MLANLALVAATLAQQHPPPHPGLVVLLGERVPAAQYAEFARDDVAGVALSTGSSQPGTEGDDPRAHGFLLQGKDTRPGDDPVAAAAVRAASRVTFSAGTLREWSEILYGRGNESALATAVREAWRGGATIVGRGERAALLSGRSVIARASELGIPECDPHDLDRPRSAAGLGLQNLAMLDTDGRSDGSFERLVRVLASERTEVGAWLDDQALLIADPAAGSLRCRGTYALVLDLRRAHQAGYALLGVRLSILRDGDAWFAHGREVELDPSRREITERSDATELALERALDADALVAALARLGDRPPCSVRARDEHCELALELDADSRVARDEHGTVSWTRLRADFSWDRR